MRHWIVASVLAFALPAFADTKVKSPKRMTVAPVKAAKQQPCKRRLVGKGLQRKVVCEFETAIVISAGPAKPKVVDRACRRAEGDGSAEAK